MSRCALAVRRICLRCGSTLDPVAERTMGDRVLVAGSLCPGCFEIEESEDRE